MDDTIQLFELSRKGPKMKRISPGFPNPEKTPFSENRKNPGNYGGYDTIHTGLGFRK